MQSRVLDKDVPVDEKKLKRNAQSVQSKKTTAFVKHGAAGIHFNDEVAFKNTKRAEKNEDPLFTQPYVSKLSDIKAVGKDELGQKAVHHKRLRQSNGPLPALFISPVISKQK